MLANGDEHADDTDAADHRWLINCEVILVEVRVMFSY